MRFRIGIDPGDVIQRSDGTTYGDRVNAAARLEGLARPGGITVSESIRVAVAGKVAAAFEAEADSWAIDSIFRPRTEGTLWSEFTSAVREAMDRAPCP